MFALLIGISLKSAAILAVAWLMARLLRGRSAAARHLVWTAAAAAILALPLLSVTMPSWRVAVPERLAPVNVGLVFRDFVTAGRPAGPATPVEHSGAPQASGPVVGGSAPWRADWRLWMTAAWAAGAALVLLQMLAAFIRMGRMRARAHAWQDADEFDALAESLGIEGRVALLEGSPGSMPMTVGVFKPAVFIPADAVDWTEERRRVVLLHELAHVRRGDVASHIIARAALSLNWWNPLAWTAWREFLKECERAADDLVLAAGARPSDYAGHLLEVARSLQSPAGTAGAALAMARPAELEGRLLAILDSRVRRHAIRRGTPLAAALAAVLLAAPFAAVRAQDQSAPAAPPELDATIRVANSQKNHEILEHAASVYESLLKYDAAQTLLEKALTIRGEVSGTQSAAYAAGLVKLGDLEMKRNRREEALAFYSKAVSLGDRPEVAGALIELGIAAMGHEGNALTWVRNNLGVTDAEAGLARDYFQRAANLDPSGPQAGTAYTWEAEMRRTETNGAAEAESLYQKALSVEDPKSPAAANTMHLYARFLILQGRSEEGDVMAKQARDITQANATQFARGIQGPGTPTFRSQTIMGADGQYVRPATASAAMPAGSTDALKVGSGVSAPVLLFKTEPAYTEEARAAKYQGTVLVYVEVGPDGYAHNIKVVRGLGLGLDEKAIEAVSQWRFRPGQKDGQAVTVKATIEVNFRLL